MPAPAPEHRLLTRGFALAWLSHFCHATATNAYIHLPGFLKALGASELFIGSLAGVTAAVAISLRPVLASAMDRAGRRVFILGAGGAHVVLCALYLTVHRLTPFVFLLRIAHGVVEAVIVSILFTYAADVVPVSRRTEGIAWFGVSGQLPVALGAFAGDYILPRTGYPALFEATMLFALVGFVASWPLPERYAPSSEQRSRGFIACALQPNLRPLWFVGVVFATAIAPVFIFLKTYVLSKGVGSVGLFLGLYSLSAVLLRLFFGWVPDRVGPKKALIPAIIAVALGMWFLSTSSSVVGVAAAGMLTGAGHGLAFPVIVALVVDRSLPSERTIAMSLVTSIFDVGQLIGGPLFGAIIEARSHAAAFAVASGVAAFGLALFLVWDRVVAPVKDGAP